MVHNNQIANSRLWHWCAKQGKKLKQLCLLKSLPCSTQKQERRDEKRKPIQTCLDVKSGFCEFRVQNIFPLDPIKLWVVCLQHQKITKHNQWIHNVYPNYVTISFNYSSLSLLNQGHNQSQSPSYLLFFKGKSVKSLGLTHTTSMLIWIHWPWWHTICNYVHDNRGKPF